MSYDPSWAEVLQIAVQAGVAAVHTSAPGKVLSYDSETQTATVQVWFTTGRSRPRHSRA